MINPQKPVINLITIFNRFTALIIIYIYSCPLLGNVPDDIAHILFIYCEFGQITTKVEQKLFYFKLQFNCFPQRINDSLTDVLIIN